MIRRLGRVDYLSTWQAMRDFTATRGPDTPDELWLLEHPAVFTLGQAGRREHLLADIGVPVVVVDRGGQVTYHGPGQAVVYVLMDLRRRGYGVKELVGRLEQAVIDLLAEHGVVGARLAGAPGVYVSGAVSAAAGAFASGRAARDPLQPGGAPAGDAADQPLPRTGISPGGGHARPLSQQGAAQPAKIAALGLRVRNGCTYHGLALNVDLDLAPFAAINPCGHAGMAVTRLKDVGIALEVAGAAQAVAERLRALL